MKIKKVVTALAFFLCGMVSYCAIGKNLPPLFFTGIVVALCVFLADISE